MQLFFLLNPKKVINIKKKEFNGINPEELKSKLKELKVELIKQNAQRSMGASTKNPKSIKVIKKTIAKILSFLNKEKRNRR